jgi:hypothetical protein
MGIPHRARPTHIPHTAIHERADFTPGVGFVSEIGHGEPVLVWFLDERKRERGRPFDLAVAGAGG